MKGRVYLVGAGPGDPGLLTLRAHELLQRCDVVLVDALVPPEVVSCAGPQAEIVYTGKRAGRHSCAQEAIHALMIAHARRGRCVVRLKGGDPFVFGRGGEEAEALAAAGIAWEVVPGVSSGVAAAALAGIPLTFRGIASSVAFVSGHRQAGREDVPVAGDADTLVLFMCRESLVGMARALVADGRPATTPVAIVRAGSRPDQQVFTGTLGEVLQEPPWLARALAGDAPALAVVGEVVALASRLRPRGLAPAARVSAPGAVEAG